jgi:elongation factor P
VQTKIKNLRNGAMKDYRFRSEDEVEKAHLDQKDMQYMYRDGDDFHFMDMSSFEQLHIPAEVLGDAVNYIIPESTISVDFYEGTRGRHRAADDGRAEDRRDLPEVKGGTAGAQRKPRTLETGLVVQVPAFVNEGRGHPRHDRGRRVSRTREVGIRNGRPALMEPTDASRRGSSWAGRPLTRPLVILSALLGCGSVMGAWVSGA